MGDSTSSKQIVSKDEQDLGATLNGQLSLSGLKVGEDIRATMSPTSSLHSQNGARASKSTLTPLNVVTSGLDNQGSRADQVPLSAPAGSVYTVTADAPETPQKTKLFLDPQSLTPDISRTRTQGTRPQLAQRHHLQNHSAKFLPSDVSEKMQRWVQEIVVCNFDIDRGPMVERRMIGRPWGKGERANV